MNFIDKAKVFEVTKQTVAQLLGDTYMTEHGYLEATSQFNIVDVGKDVEDSCTTENVFKSLVSQLAKLEVMSNPITKEVPSMFVNSMEWGGFIERVYADVVEVLEGSLFDVVGGADYSAEEHTYYKANIEVKIFNECKAIRVPISRSEEAIKEAFTSWGQMSTFLNAILEAVNNTLDTIDNAIEHALISSAIAISDKATNNAVHLVTEAITEGYLESGATAEDFLASDSCKVYMLKRIKEVRDAYKLNSTMFNNGNMPRTALDNNLVLLNKIDNIINFEVLPNIYHADKLAIGDYDTMTAWQSFKKSDGTTLDFDTCSSIMIKADSENKLGLGTSAVTINSAIGVLYSRKAIGYTRKHRKQTSSYTASRDFVNIFNHIDYNTIIDTNLPITAFILD